MVLASGTHLGPYEIQTLLGAGGMGVVYLARDSRLGRDVALKVLSAPPHEHTDPRAQLLREARAAASLNHPHICTIHDVGDQDGCTFIVMELLKGQTLAERINGRPLPIPEVLKFGREIADALGAAHAKGIIHRDVKPSNVFVTSRTEIKVLDFGLARVVDGYQGASTTCTALDIGVAAGTLPYMAPEQLKGELVDARTDVYALAAVLYEMATGLRPFPESSAVALIDSILHGRPAVPSALISHVPVSLEQLILKCLSRDTIRRCQSMHEVMECLNPTASTTPDSHPPRRSTAVVRSRRTSKRKIIRSIAVLPLSSLPAEAEQDYFVEGMTEALITELAKLGVLKIISRTSVMRYKGVTRPVPEIADELSVDAVLEGTVLRVGNRVRISAQLIDGGGDDHLWADSYERDLADVLSLQREIGQAIARSIDVATTRTQQRHARSIRLNPKAHEAYLKGRFHANKRTSEGLQRALEFFNLSVQCDPTYAAGYAGLSDCYVLRADRSLSHKETMIRARRAAQKALSLDDRLADPHASLASVAFRWDWDWVVAEREFGRAIVLNPSDVSIRHRYAFFLAAMHRMDEALAHMQRGLELDPLSLVASVGVGRILDLARHHDAAIQQFQNSLEMDPRFAEAHFDLAMAYRHRGMYDRALEATRAALELSPDSSLYQSHLCHLHGLAGRADDARAILDQLRDRSTRTYVSPALFAWGFLGLGETGQALDWLDIMYDDRSAELVYLAVDPGWDSLRSTARFAELLGKIGLPTS